MTNGMMHGADEWLATRRSLLTRLRDAGDQTGWQEFFETYWKLLYRVARKSGLTEAEAQDAVQETIITVAQQMPEFRYEPARCSFKGWLLLLTRQRIAHQFRKRNKVGVRASARSDMADSPDTLKPKLQHHDSPAFVAVDEIPDPAGSQLEAIWDEEWQQHLFSAALEQVKQKVSDRQFQIFDLHALQNWSVREVARTLRVSSAQVYLAKHRISSLLKKEVRKLQETTALSPTARE